MKKRIILLSILLTTKLLSFSQNNGISGARSYGLAGNSILLQDLWSTNNNPAGLAFQKEWAAGIPYENQFLQSELSNKTAIIGYPISNGAFGLSINQFGYSAYNENRVGLSYGQQLGKNISMGIQINYLNTRIGEAYGTSSAISGNIGLMAKLNDELSIAAMLINPNKAKLADYTDERYPTLIKLGLGYEFSDKVTLMSEVAKDIDFDANVKVGIEYKAMKLIHFRIGYATEPALSSFGFGINLDQFKLDFASGFDSTFGFSPQISLHYSPSQKQ
ncbi:MAG: hypothetical protein JKY48_14720 [Flavobacteriales bacterium]|nr:hypothetical protein [Flavobacteriales bacterium]